MVRRERAWIAGASLIAVTVPPVLLWKPVTAEVTPVAAVRPVALSPVPPMPAAPLFGAGRDGTAADGPELVGIVGRLPDDAVALVRRADGRTRSLRLGEATDGWTLASLSADAAAFTRGAERLRVAMPAGE